MSPDYKTARNKKLSSAINNCKKCGLYLHRTHAVVGQGSLRAKIMFVGEAPGQMEDQSGLPFVGRSGKVLDRLLDAANLDRGEVFITSILKCRPPRNRNPKSSEIRACAYFLEEQLRLIEPIIIAPLGNFASAYLFEKYGIRPARISEAHGNPYIIRRGKRSLVLVPQFHPAVALYNANEFKLLVKDFRVLKKFFK